MAQYDDDDDDSDKEKAGLSDVDKEILLLKWRDFRDPILMEPLKFEPHTYTVEQTLRERFKETGLQIIVKMASIELTPEKPRFPEGGWHVSLHSTHHIVC